MRVSTGAHSCPPAYSHKTILFKTIFPLVAKASSVFLDEQGTVRSTYNDHRAKRNSNTKNEED